MTREESVVRCVLCGCGMHEGKDQYGPYLRCSNSKCHCNKYAADREVVLKYWASARIEELSKKLAMLDASVAQASMIILDVKERQAFLTRYIELRDGKVVLATELM